VYKFDPTTLEYCGEHECQLSPLEKGVYLMPQHFTKSEPPPKKEWITPIFKDGKWVEVLNTKNFKSFDDNGNPKLITEFGEDIREPPPIELVKPKWNGSKFVESGPASEVLERKTLIVQDRRAFEYGPIGEQLDYIYHNGIEKWKIDIVDPVKDANPLPK